ncbi:hypothetical protein HRM2_27210 [Desulforapulum autotrophicum HRM2]|uniref:Uncharacterized protein n=1 Tax=Desulforapulum autotrophicum (strain ATCC 43914 / DSM 3382 / VKM B-1955 / HRM2) TaxID=177437 RepID=C0QI77_DESAH|nr:hypothetical protein [Desulforapulum autotrophicum]ACN15813.1 hypothetical protein HRM2_27210 [Desulforapulum autotrophicum HRM2]
MPRALKRNRAKWFYVLIIALFAVLGLMLWVGDRLMPEKKESTMATQVTPSPVQSGNGPSVVSGTIEQLPEIDFSKLEKANELTRMMDRRKQELGIGKSLDMIVGSDEAFKVGRTIVYMKDILKKSLLTKNRVVGETIEASGAVVPESTSEYGIHVVRKGDNIWNIHFGILQDYYKARGVPISNKADEPRNGGLSSGIGKLLKFSETIVTIYNILDEDVAKDINLLEPLSKIVVYNMTEVFSLLQEIDYDNVDRIRFDGEAIWIPAQQPDKKAMN